jgi:hypothetical protein
MSTRDWDAARRRARVGPQTGPTGRLEGFGFTDRRPRTDRVYSVGRRIWVGGGRVELGLGYERSGIDPERPLIVWMSWQGSPWVRWTLIEEAVVNLTVWPDDDDDAASGQLRPRRIPPRKHGGDLLWWVERRSDGWRLEWQDQTDGPIRSMPLAVAFALDQDDPGDEILHVASHVTAARRMSLPSVAKRVRARLGGSVTLPARLSRSRGV